MKPVFLKILYFQFAFQANIVYIITLYLNKNTGLTYRLGKEPKMDEKLLKNGAFSWFELMTTDVEGAKAFYSKLLGWKTEDIAMANINYTVVKVNEEDVAGIMTMPPDSQDMPPTWGIYITVDDVDATTKLAIELGGKVLVEPREIPDVGKFSVIQDPQGAWFAAITYNQ